MRGSSCGSGVDTGGGLDGAGRGVCGAVDAGEQAGGLVEGVSGGALLAAVEFIALGLDDLHIDDGLSGDAVDECERADGVGGQPGQAGALVDPGGRVGVAGTRGDHGADQGDERDGGRGQACAPGPARGLRILTWSRAHRRLPGVRCRGIGRVQCAAR